MKWFVRLVRIVCGLGVSVLLVRLKILPAEALLPDLCSKCRSSAYIASRGVNGRSPASRQIGEALARLLSSEHQPLRVAAAVALSESEYPPECYLPHLKRAVAREANDDGDTVLLAQICRLLRARAASVASVIPELIAHARARGTSGHIVRSTLGEVLRHVNRLEGVSPDDAARDLPGLVEALKHDGGGLENEHAELSARLAVLFINCAWQAEQARAYLRTLCDELTLFLFESPRHSNARHIASLVAALDALR